MALLPALTYESGEVQDHDAIGHLPQAHRDALNGAHAFSLSEYSDAIRQAYQSDFADFSSDCDGFGLSPLPAHPGTVAPVSPRFEASCFPCSAPSWRLPRLASLRPP
jgi:hypothetical protein